MTRRDEVLENHTLVIGDGRILDVLPNALADEKYAAREVLESPGHLLMPGLVNARTRIAAVTRTHGARYQPETGLKHLANMLRDGITCFCDVGYFPAEVARTAAAQGLRALIGLPIAENAQPFAPTAGDCLSRALDVRDEYKGHPSISTGFAPLDSTELADATLARLGTLADELDAGILMSLHASPAEVAASRERYRVGPLERLQALGLLTPALSAAHMTQLEAGDIDLVQRSGMTVVLCLAADLVRAAGMAPAAALARASVGLGLGTDGAETAGSGSDIWSEIRLLALLAPYSSGPASPALSARGFAAEAGLSPWDVLDSVTRGGAKALGLDTQIGTLERGKWADCIHIDMGGPATQPVEDPIRQLVFSGGRDMVRDIWVAGRQLFSKGQFTRIDWPSVAARLRSGG